MNLPSKLRYWEVSLSTAFAIVAAFVCILSVWAQMQIALNNDHLDLLDMARRLLDGGKPYVAYSDINPPLIHMIYSLPVKMSRAFDLPQATSLYVFTYSLVIVALLLVWRSLHHSAVAPHVSAITLVTIALSLVSASFIHQPFGDREHLMMVLTTPWYIFCSPLCRRQSIPVIWRFLIAMMAGIGFAIKPYFYVFYIASVCYLMMAEQSIKSVLLKWEHYIVWAVAVIYLAIILIFFDEYIKTALPLAIKTYSAMGWSMQAKLGVLWNDLLGGYAAVGLLGAVFLWVFKQKLYSNIITYIIVLLIAACGSYLLNGGWYYTQYPFIAISLALIVSVGSRAILMCKAIVRPRQQIAAAVVTMATLVACLVNSHAIPAHYRAMWDMRVTAQRGEPIANIPMQPEARKKIDQHLESHPRFIFMTTSLRAVNLMKEGAPQVNVGRYDYFWPLPGILSYEKSQYQRKTYESLIEYFIGTMADDIRDYKPDMVIHNVSPQQWDLPPSYRMVDLFLKDKRFEEVWRDYTLVDTINVCTAKVLKDCAYEIYYRKSP